MSGVVDPFSNEFSIDFGSGSVGGWFSMPATAGLSLKVTGLTPGATYQFRVFAINVEGSGPPSPVLTLTI
jgi:hypothetical protein